MRSAEPGPPSVGWGAQAPPSCLLSALGPRAHGCGRHLGGGRRLRRAEGGRAGTAVLAGRGLRASPQGLPLRAAVLRRWVRLQGVVAQDGAPGSPRNCHGGREGVAPSPGAAPPPRCAPETPGEEGGGRYCPVGHICSLSGEGGWGWEGPAAALALISGHQAVGSLDAEGGRRR